MITSTKLNKILFILLLFIACEELSPPTISNDITVSQDYEMYLYGVYSNKNQLNLFWRDYYGCNSYDISIPDINYEATDTQEQTYHYINDINYNPGYYFTAYVSCSEEQEIEYSDSIIINTQEINPIDNITVHVESGGYNDSLTFSHSSDLSIYKWKFYNFLFDKNNRNTLPHYFNETDIAWSSPDSTIEKLDFYIHQKENLDDSFCYVIRTIDDKNYFRDSHIKCGGDFTTDEEDITGVEITSITNNLQKRIVLEWQEYADDDFYQYIIWRSEYENMPEDSKEKRAVVIEKNQTDFHDRRNMFDGKKWYYQIEVENQYGISKISEIEVGTTSP